MKIESTKKQNSNSVGFPKKIFIGIAMLATCLMASPARASLDNPVSRPVKVSGGHLLITVDPGTGDYEFIDWGTASHIGQYQNSGAGVLNLDTGVFVSGTGVIIGADGDEIHWMVGGGVNTVFYTGGTGRFLGVTGRFPVTITSQTLISINEDGTLTFLMTYDGEGVITY